jgi:hypothetical protein
MILILLLGVVYSAPVNSVNLYFKAEPLAIYVNETLRVPLAVQNGTLLGHHISINRDSNLPSLCSLIPTSLNVTELLLRNLIIEPGEIEVPDQNI